MRVEGMGIGRMNVDVGRMREKIIFIFIDCSHQFFTVVRPSWPLRDGLVHWCGARTINSTRAHQRGPGHRAFKWRAFAPAITRLLTGANECWWPLCAVERKISHQSAPAAAYSRWLGGGCRRTGEEKDCLLARSAPVTGADECWWPLFNFSLVRTGAKFRTTPFEEGTR